MVRNTLRMWALLAAAVSAAAQVVPEGAPSEAEQPYFEAVDVNVVNVEVFVTDREGQPVLGLTRDDFLLYEDRRPVEITNFYAVQAGQPGIAPPTPRSAGPRQTPPVDREELALPETQRLFLIVYVDNFNIRPLNRNRVFRRLREFLHDQVDLADQVMLVSYDRSLHVRQPFTSDSGLIARALYELEEMTGHAVGQDAERREVLQAIDEAKTATEVEWKVRQFAESLDNDLSFTLSALKEFVESLSGLEGRKAVLYVSDGLPMTPAEELFQALGHKFTATAAMSRMQDFAAHRRFRELAAVASSGRVSFYTIDAAGLRGSIVHEAASRGLVATPGLPTLVDSTYIQNLQEPLRYMAEETGGKAIINTNDILPGLEAAARDFQNYYSLGFMSSHFGDGRYHRIKVEVKDRKGLTVRHRSGYRAKDVFARMAEGTRATMLYGFGSNPLGVTVAVGQASPHERDVFIVPVRIDIPLGNLELVPQGEFFIGRLNLYVNALDTEGGTADTQRVPLDIKIPREEIDYARTQPYVYRAELQMRRGSHRMALGVRDEIGAIESFVSKTVMVGAA